jgi:hypothetical protein
LQGTFLQRTDQTRARALQCSHPTGAVARHEFATFWGERGSGNLQRNLSTGAVARAIFATSEPKRGCAKLQLKPFSSRRLQSTRKIFVESVRPATRTRVKDRRTRIVYLSLTNGTLHGPLFLSHTLRPATGPRSHCKPVPLATYDPEKGFSCKPLCPLLQTLHIAEQCQNQPRGCPIATKICKKCSDQKSPIRNTCKTIRCREFLERPVPRSPSRKLVRTF